MTTKPDHIKVIGIITAVFSGLGVLCNTAGSIMFFIISKKHPPKYRTSDTFNIFHFVANHLTEFLLAVILLCIVFLIGGIGLMLYKRWCALYLTIATSIVILALWTLLIVVTIEISSVDRVLIGPLFSGFILTLPFAAYLWFLNRGQTKVQLDQ